MVDITGFPGWHQNRKKNRVIRELKLVVSPFLGLTNHHFIEKYFQALLLHPRRRRRNLGVSLCVLANSSPGGLTLPVTPRGQACTSTSSCQFQSPLSSLPPNLPLPPCGYKVKNCYPCVTSISYTDTSGVYSVPWGTLDRGLGAGLASQ